tara:strand:- start:568 stop:714 length:147 start_codon:yes stop_codon:yes gene_type:complete
LWLEAVAVQDQLLDLMVVLEQVVLEQTILELLLELVDYLFLLLAFLLL